MDHKASPEWEQLERLLKSVGFGEVFNLPVQDGKPCLKRRLRIRTSRLLGQRSPTRATQADGKGLRAEHFVDLIRFCERRRNVVITKLTVHEGLPHRIEIEGETTPE